MVHLALCGDATRAAQYVSVATDIHSLCVPCSECIAWKAVHFDMQALAASFVGCTDVCTYSRSLLSSKSLQVLSLATFVCRAYDMAAIMMHGMEEAMTNFPKETYVLQRFMQVWNVVRYVPNYFAHAKGGLHCCYELCQYYCFSLCYINDEVRAGTQAPGLGVFRACAAKMG